MRAKLGDIFEISSGGTPSKSHPEYYGGDIPWVKTGDLKKEYLYEVEDFITEEGLKNSSAKMYESDTVLIAMYGATIGATSILKMNACTNQACAAFKKNEQVIPEYLYYFLRSQKDKFVKDGVGGAQPNISAGYLKKVEMELPSIDEQRIIVNILDKISNIIVNRNQEMISLDDLIKARFVEMFGDPVSNSYGLPEATLPELGKFGRGVSKHRPRNDPRLLDGEYPLVQTGDVANASLYITSYNSTYSELGLKQSKMWSKGTLCITIAANIAKTAILEFDACFPDSVVGFIANEKTNNIFIHYWFSFFQAILESQAPESAQKNINLKILSELKVIVPEKEKQNEFVDFVHQVDKSKDSVQKALDEAQLLFDSLMQQYFG